MESPLLKYHEWISDNNFLDEKKNLVELLLRSFPFYQQELKPEDSIKELLVLFKKIEEPLRIYGTCMLLHSVTNRYFESLKINIEIIKSEQEKVDERSASFLKSWKNLEKEFT